MESNIMRLTYSRGESVKYVSHLDFVHVFERALRRAEIDVAYSKGFNPRMEMVFGNPLPVGYTSTCERVDIEFNVNYNSDFIINSLNSVLPKDIRIISSEPLEKPYDAIVKAYTTAEYEISVKGENLTDFHNKSREFLDKNETFSVMKKTKSGEKETDIRPMIKEYCFLNDTVNLGVSCSAQENLRPELVLENLAEKFGFSIEIVSILKRNLYKNGSIYKF